MQSKVVASLFFVASILVLPIAAGALGLDVQARGGAGIAGGTTSNTAITGALRLAASGGAVLDFYAFQAGPVAVGLSAGAEYALLNEHSTITQSGVTTTVDDQYNYLYFPVALVGNYAVNKGISVTLRAGGFIGDFLSGNQTTSFSPQVFPTSTSTVTTSDIKQIEYGIHVSGGPNFALGPRLTLSPSVELNWGLSNINPSGSETDTLWSLVGNVGLEYKLF